ncbi:hypothetical protein [Actinomadura sp. K4S16]|uniref:hypothetical protein n=1 Tax=Actinomadura sp. K4S16 TaxID=1316147 RepID=UPI0011ED10A0|nr:hypothetical protein [Actinomadura sp. K4S16]
MTTSSFDLPGAILWLDEAPRGLRLYPAYDGAKVELTVRAWASQTNSSDSVRLAATLTAGPRPHQGQQPLGRVLATNRITVSSSPTALVFTGYVSGQALREVEEMRQGGPLWLELNDMRADGMTGGRVALLEFSGSNLPIEVLAEEWASQLERVTASAYVEILVPVTEDATLATAAGRLRTARSYIRDGVCSAVAPELRQALDPVREAYETQTAAATARTKKPRERSTLERWALMVEDTYALLSAFIHDDEEAIAGASLDRAMAVDLLGDVAGKVHRLAADRRAEKI